MKDSAATQRLVFEMTEIEKAIENLRFGEAYPPATEKAINEAQKLLNVKFPQQYIEFLKITNGLASNHFYLDQVEDLFEINEIYEIKEWMSDWLIIGNDGGGYAILFNLSEKEATPYLCEHGSLIDSDCPVKQADNLFDWLINGAEQIHYPPDWTDSPEVIQKANDINFKKLVREARQSFKNKDYRKATELFAQAQLIKELEDKLDLKFSEYAKKHQFD